MWKQLSSGRDLQDEDGEEALWILTVFATLPMISGERKGSLMPSVSIHVKVSGALQDHMQRQIGDEGLYENASEYIRALIRRDLHTRDEAWEALQKELAPAMRADDSEFVAVTADDVIRRNKRG